MFTAIDPNGESNMTDIVILEGARTAIGTFGGALASAAPIDLATVASEAAIRRSGVALASPAVLTAGLVHLDQSAAKQYSRPAPPVPARLSCEHPRDAWAEFHDVLPPP